MKILKKIIKKFGNLILNTFFYDRWIIGVVNADIKEVIRKKKFDVKVTWLTINKPWESYADPFILKTDTGYDIFYERYLENGIGDIWLMKLNSSLKISSNVPVFEDPMHVSFPFLHKENGKIYIIPETAGEKKLFRFEYDEENSAFINKEFIMHQAILDPAILKHKDTYWLFGAKRDQQDLQTYESWLYSSKNLEGPYLSHPQSPYIKGLDGVRAAGNFINVDGVLYRPTQNCREEYGKSITIKKILELSETEIKVENYMKITIDNIKNKKGVFKVHTINSAGNVIVIDGVQRVFSLDKPFRLLKNFIAPSVSMFSIESANILNVYPN